MNISDTEELSSQELVSVYKQMVFFRHFEERVNFAYTQQKFSGFCHLHTGQEALCVGIQKLLLKEDYVISGYRSHTQAIAKGIPSEQVFSELLGKESGCSKGRGGSMHMFSNTHRFLGGHGIVGAQAPIATGVGFKIKYNNEDNICVCYLGDAAMNQGQVFEALNMAAIWQLPVLFIIENNLYGMGTAISRTTSVKNLKDRALAFNIKNKQIDGMNVLEVYKQMKPIVEQVRKTKEPYLVESMTYRYKGHSVSDAATYRTKEEVKKFQEKDPILQLKLKIIADNISDEATLKLWDKEAKELVKKAQSFAEDAQNPEIEDLYLHVYKESKKDHEQ